MRETPYTVEPEAMNLLYRNSWTGNIGELELFVQRLAVEIEERSHIMAEDVSRLLRLNDSEAYGLEIPNGGAIAFPTLSRCEENISREDLIHVPPYRVGEKPGVFLARSFLFIYRTLMERYGNSHGKVAQLMNVHRNNLYRRVATEQKHLSGTTQHAQPCPTDKSAASSRRQFVAH